MSPLSQVPLFPGRRILLVIAASASMVGIAGCNWGDRMVPVFGRVTHRGRPVPDAILRFVPEKGQMAAAGTDASGRYRVTTVRPGDGLRAGHYKVVITPWIPGIGADQTPPAEPKRLDIPQVYQEITKTPLFVEVTVGRQNEFDFDLGAQSGKKRIRRRYAGSGFPAPPGNVRSRRPI